MADMLIEVNAISKDFSGVVVLDKVNFCVKAGEIHGLIGENGAGKSTLMKILTGVYPQGEYSGEIIYKGKPVSFKRIKDSESIGIQIINQELEVVDELTVAENIYLGHEPMKGGLIDKNELYHRAEKLLRDINSDINVAAEVGTLGVGQKQMVCIARALSKQTELLILDEPTAALTETETEALFAILRKLKSKQIGCIYISHRLAEIKQICDRITVLRDGKSITSGPVNDYSMEAIVSAMVGRELSNYYPAKTALIREEILRVTNYSFTDAEGHSLVKDINFSVKRGEIVGVAGLMGAGRTELVMSLVGAVSGNARGEVFLENQRVAFVSPSQAIQCGIGYVPEDRKDMGLVLDMDLIKNTTLSSLEKHCKNGVINQNSEIRACNALFSKLNVKYSSLFNAVGSLSGGNQQKIVLAKALASDVKLLILDEPTRGVDVGAKYEIYGAMNQLAAEGVGIIMVSSDLQEVIGMSDRVLVMQKGTITGELSADEATQERIMALATL